MPQTLDQINQAIADTAHNSLVLVQFQYKQLKHLKVVISHVMIWWQNSNNISIEISKTYIEHFPQFAKFYMIISPKMAPYIENMEALILKIE